MKRFISLLICVFTLSQLHAAASDKKPVNDRKMYMLVSPEGYALKNTLDGEVAPHILVPADRKDKSLQHAFHEDEGGWIIWCPANGKAFDTDGSKTGGIRLGSWGMVWTWTAGELYRPHAQCRSGHLEFKCRCHE